MTELQFAELDKEKVREAVLGCYDFPASIQIVLLKYSENMTYTLWDEVSGEKYVLRVFHPGYHEEEEMSGELTWIHQLKKDIDIETADVLPGKDGELVCRIQLGEDQLYCALFEYIEGSSLKEVTGQLFYDYLAQMGEITAKLHLHAQNWEGAGKLVRFSWDIDDLLGPSSRWGDFSLMQGLPKEWMDWFGEASAIIRKRLATFGHTPDKFGLIHDDISINNTLVKDGKVYLLDFDDCGFGWFLYDIPTMVLEDFGETMEENLKWVLKGYEKIRPLTEEEKQELPTFLLLKKIVRIGWIATRSKNDTVKKLAPDYFENAAKMAKAYCENYR